LWACPVHIHACGAQAQPSDDNGFAATRSKPRWSCCPASRYLNKSTYAAERKRMLQWWADYVDATVDGGKVLIGNFG